MLVFENLNILSYKEHLTLTKRKKKELLEKISEISHLRRMVTTGLIVSIILVFLGQLIPFPALFIVGYTVFLICISAVAFFTVSKWQYSKMLKTEVEKETEPSTSWMCPRCGTSVQNYIKYCPKCGKKIQTRKR